jgi:hypothetical protein
MRDSPHCCIDTERICCAGVAVGSALQILDIHQQSGNKDIKEELHPEHCPYLLHGFDVMIK